MNIKVIYDGELKDGCTKVSVAITRCHTCREIARIEFLAVLRALNDTNPKTFMDALEAFFKSELEHDNDEE